MLLLNLLRATEVIGGSMVLTSATSLLAQEFVGAERTRAFSFLSTAFGPMVSGFLIDHLGWRSLYFAIALIAAVILLLGARRIRDPATRRRKASTGREPCCTRLPWYR